MKLVSICANQNAVYFRRILVPNFMSRNWDAIRSPISCINQNTYIHTLGPQFHVTQKRQKFGVSESAPGDSHRKRWLPGVMADPDDSQEGCQEKWVFLSQMFILEALAQLQRRKLDLWNNNEILGFWERKLDLWKNNEILGFWERKLGLWKNKIH